MKYIAHHQDLLPIFILQYPDYFYFGMHTIDFFKRGLRYAIYDMGWYNAGILLILIKSIYFIHFLIIRPDSFETKKSIPICIP